MSRFSSNMVRLSGLSNRPQSQCECNRNKCSPQGTMRPGGNWPCMTLTSQPAQLHRCSRNNPNIEYWFPAMTHNLRRFHRCRSISPSRLPGKCSPGNWFQWDQYPRTNFHRFRTVARHNSHYFERTCSNSNAFCRWEDPAIATLPRFPIRPWLTVPAFLSGK
jgi:hypothetical protein